MMVDHDGQVSRRWNLFARELEDILDAHGVRLSQLFHRTSLNPAPIARLQKSLKKPTHFPVLSQPDLDEIIHVFALTSEEQLRLRAAILVTAIERVLMDRLDVDNALLAAEQIWPVLLNAVRTYAETGKGLGLGILRGAPSMTPFQEEEDSAFDPVFDALDRASLALLMSDESGAPYERLAQIRQAHNGFSLALKELENLPASVKTEMDWHVWHAEAQQGLDECQCRLDLLE